MNGRRLCICLCLLFIFLPGCRDHVKTQRHKEADYELRARCFDLVIPVHATLLQDMSPHSDNEMRAQTIISYQVYTCLTDLKNLYRIEMERLGWQCVVTFEPCDGDNATSATILFEKPYQRCVIIIDQDSQTKFSVRCLRSFIG